MLLGLHAPTCAGCSAGRSSSSGAPLHVRYACMFYKPAFPIFGCAPPASQRQGGKLPAADAPCAEQRSEAHGQPRLLVLRRLVAFGRARGLWAPPAGPEQAGGHHGLSALAPGRRTAARAAQRHCGASSRAAPTRAVKQRAAQPSAAA